MKAIVKRIFNNDKYCISHVYIDGEYVCDAIEDTDRMLDQSMSEQYIINHKVYAKTAIPTGTYRMTTNFTSPKFSKKAYYKSFCNGKLPRVLGVKGFDGVLWHRGATERDSAGCLILGYNKVKGKVVNSQQAFEKVYKMLKTSNNITVTYERTYTR